MIYKHYWVLISIYAGARDRMARDAARHGQRGKEDNESGAPRGTWGTAAGIYRGRTGRRRTSRATNQPFWTNYEWYIRCARLIYAYLPSVPPSRSRGTAASENPTVLCIQTRARATARALKNHVPPPPRISAFSTRPCPIRCVSSRKSASRDRQYIDRSGRLTRFAVSYSAS